MHKGTKGEQVCNAAGSLGPSARPWLSARVGYAGEGRRGVADECAEGADDFWMMPRTPALPRLPSDLVELGQLLNTVVRKINAALKSASRQEFELKKDMAVLERNLLEVGAPPS